MGSIIIELGLYRRDVRKPTQKPVHWVHIIRLPKKLGLFSHRKFLIGLNILLRTIMKTIPIFMDEYIISSNI